MDEKLQLRLADARAVVLVEGVSDRTALEALAVRRGRELNAEGVSVVPIGGAQSIGRFLSLLGPQGLDVRLAGLCDAAEEGDFRRFMGSGGRRKIRYARLLVDALDLAQVRRPLDLVLTHV